VNAGKGDAGRKHGHPRSTDLTALRWLPALAVATLCLNLATGAPAGAEELLSCGSLLNRTLSPGQVQRFRFTVPPKTGVSIQASDIDGDIGLLRLRVDGPDGERETCRGTLDFVSDQGGDMTLAVSSCLEPSSGGTYTLSLHVVSGGADNCARSLQCGTTPDGIGFKVPGQVDAYGFFGEEGQRVTLAFDDITDSLGGIRLRLFGPEGEPVPGAEVCRAVPDQPSTSTFTTELPETGMYTALLSACTAPTTGPYRITYQADGCPIGPYITYFGLTTSETVPTDPIGVDAQGRSIYFSSLGWGMSLVVEARPGPSGRAVGATTFVSQGLPSLQMILSRPLGDGDPTVCDIEPPKLAGVPATQPFAFSTSQRVVDAINDLGCRFDDGRRHSFLGRGPTNACTRTDEGFFGFGFVDPTSTLQYCGQIALDWRFPLGDTVVAARATDVVGHLGAPREIVVRVAVAGTPSPTRTPTRPPATPTRTRTTTPTRTRPATPTRTHTGTPTRVPKTPSPAPTQMPTSTAEILPTQTQTPRSTPTPRIGPCIGDCDGDVRVTISELGRAVSIALGRAPIASCPSADGNDDLIVGVGELIVSVQNALLGCPLPAPPL
jgi:hypothetical protein